MSIYDPPEPPENLHPCRYCDHEMEQEWPAYKHSEYICVNEDCTHSPYYTVRKPQTRDIVIRFYRHKGLPPSSEVEIIRNDEKRIYKNPAERHITALNNIVHHNRIKVECDFYLFTEITFQFDYEP